MILMPVGGDVKERVLVGERASQCMLGSLQTPSGLIHVQMPAPADGIQQIFVGLGERLPDTAKHPVDRSGRQTRLKELFHELHRVASREAVAHRERRDRRLQPGPR